MQQHQKLTKTQHLPKTTQDEVRAKLLLLIDTQHPMVKWKQVAPDMRDIEALMVESSINNGLCTVRQKDGAV